jgi:hypothetical protein
METAVLAALAGLFGIVLGRVWDLRLEAVRWRRDQRVRVYEDLAATYYAAREPLLVLAMAEPGTPEADAAAIRALAIAAEWNRGVVATWFHGSSLVTATLQQFDQQLSRLFDKARACRLTWEEFADEHRATEESLEAFIEAVRQELKHPPLKVSVRIPRLRPLLSDGRTEPQAGASPTICKSVG